MVTLTEAGEVAFARLRDTAIAFDAKLRAGLADADLATLNTLLGRIAANVGAGEAAPPLGRPPPGVTDFTLEYHPAWASPS